jgi:6-phosphogluconolactonase/glucosamine-6-phosphate isomerase/deaminase
MPDCTGSMWREPRCASNQRGHAAFLYQHLIAPAKIAADQVRLLRGDAADMEAECRAYDAALAACGGIDLCVLGLGTIELCAPAERQ